MKKWLRRILTQRQYKALLRLKNQTLPDLMYRLSQLPFLLVGSVIIILPDKSKVTLKSGINIVKKMDYQRRAIYLNIDSDFEYRIRLHSCKKEPETVEWIETFLRQGDVLYDVGANDGAYSLVAAKFFDGKVTVYGFEPTFLNFTQLCRNLALNGCEGSVIPLQIALSDKTSVEIFNYRNLVPGGAIHALGEAVGPDGDAFQPVLKLPILSYRADDLIKQFNIPIPNHIKIDVDGTEFAILNGMDETLNNPSVRSMLLEVNEGRVHVSQIIQFLAKKGFEIHSKHGINYIFVRKD